MQYLAKITATVFLIAGPSHFSAPHIEMSPDGVVIMRDMSLQEAEAWSRPGMGMGGPPGPGLKSASGELKPGEPRVFELNWPDDLARYYLEQEAPDLYRRVELADKEGYTVSLRPIGAGADRKVELEAVRKALVGGKYDDTIKAFVGKPTLVKTICTTTAPIRPGTATVVVWRAPTTATHTVSSLPVDPNAAAGAAGELQAPATPAWAVGQWRLELEDGDTSTMIVLPSGAPAFPELEDILVAGRIAADGRFRAEFTPPGEGRGVLAGTLRPNGTGSGTLRRPDDPDKTLEWSATREIAPGGLGGRPGQTGAQGRGDASYGGGLGGGGLGGYGGGGSYGGGLGGGGLGGYGGGGSYGGGLGGGRFGEYGGGGVSDGGGLTYGWPNASYGAGRKARLAAAFAPQPSGVAIVLRAAPEAAAVLPPASTAVAELKGETEPAVGADFAHILMECELIELPVDSPEYGDVMSAKDRAEALKDLIDQGKARSIGSPRIVVQNNRRGEISIGSAPPEPPDPAAGGATPANLEEQVPLGYSLAVTPRVLADGRISMAVECRLEKLAGWVTGPDGESIPVMSSAVLTARPVAAHRGTVAIGGLNRLRRDVGEDGKTVVQAMDIMILLTPLVIDRADVKWQPAAAQPGVATPTP